jgi:hypothetical protein
VVEWLLQIVSRLSAQPGTNFPFHLAVNFSEFDKEPSGKVNLIGQVKYVLFISPQLFNGLHSCRSHPDVAEIHYPQLFKHIFPTGYSGGGSAY